MDTKFSMALHIAVFISETEKVVTSEVLAASIGTNASHIRKITNLLKESDIIESQQGKKRMVLKVNPEDLTLDRIYRTVYPEKHLLHIHETANRQCPIGANIREALLPIFEESERSLTMNLGNKTLRSFIQDMYDVSSATSKKGEDHEGGTDNKL